jgi:hypothetical protein
MHSNLKIKKPESSHVVTHERVSMHSNRSQAFSFKGDVMKKLIETPLCACGCGERVKWGRGSKKWNTFLNNHHRKNKKHSKESREKIRKTKTGLKASEMHKENMRKGLIGRKLSEEHKENIKKALQKSTLMIESRLKQKNGVTTYKGYCNSWGDKEYIKDLRNPACNHCGITNRMSLHLFGYQLNTHHKNGKENCAPKDIETVCLSCHTKEHARLRRYNAEKVNSRVNRHTKLLR